MKNAKWMRILAAIMIVLVFVTACGQLTASNNSESKVENVNSVRTLTITGHGQVTLAPDIARVNVGVNSREADVTSAVDENNKLAKAITDALVKKGVEVKDIQTANFNVYPIQQYNNMGEQTGVLYSVDNTLYITVRDLKTLSEVLDAAITAGANQINGISFDINERTEAQNKARDLALKDAENKAKEVAKTVGVSLDEIQSITVTNNSYAQPYPMYGMGGGEKMSMDSSVPISAGQIVVTYEVYLVYRIK